jgi:integrase
MSLPKYVYLLKGRYVYRPYDPVTKKKGKEITLCSATSSMAELWTRYEQVTAKQEVLTLRLAITQYLSSPDCKALSPRSRKDNDRFAKQVVETPMKSGAVFGDMALCAITTGTLQKYLDKRTEQAAPVSGNKEVGFLSSVFNWHKRRDNVTNNPASSVKRNKTEARTRYVTDEEYEAFIDLARDAPSYLVPMMEIAYLCRARRVEILAMKKSYVTAEGLTLFRAKGSKNQIIGWTERLRRAIAMCDTPETVTSEWLIHDSKGQCIAEEAFTSSWQRWQMKFAELGYERFTFHDLKAKGVSDFDGDKLKASGHKTAAMLNVYDRKIDTVTATK